MIDFGSLFKDATVAGVPLLLFVIALVQWIKLTFKLEGSPIRIVSMVAGLVLGIGYQASASLPADFGGWFTVVIFGLLLGLGASGVYDAFTSATRASME